MESVLLIAGATAIAVLLPNTNQLMRYRFGAGAMRDAATSLIQWRPTLAWGLGLGVLLLVTLVVGVTSRDKLEFLYFQF
jgi:hypothetical protein